MTTTPIRPTREHEAQFPGPVAGMDEAGCGPWAGPLVAAAVILPPADRQGNYPALPSYMELIRDSKQLNASQRHDLYEQLCNDPTIQYGVGVVDVHEIDALLLRGALPLAYHRAFANLPMLPQAVLIDGIRDPKLGLPTMLLKQGDQKSLAIAAASILAKVTRDRLMLALHDTYPAYSWSTNMGYGTKAHQEALMRHGVTSHHRKSYAPIQKILANC